MTSSEQGGDFKRAVATQIAGRLGGDPVVVVVKKNASILRNLTEWITTSNGRPDPQTGRPLVPGLPLLVIDDEADNASVNTKEIEFNTDEDGRVIAETDPAVINGLIRRLLHSFEQSAYVGYTATPFVNIFIDEERRSPEYGEDLFPRSFILRIPPPSNYLGPAEVFGVAAAEDPQGQGRTARPIVRSIGDHEDWVPDRHRKDWVPGALPASLIDAMGAFLLTCAARAARGQEHVHNSMLVHVTRFVDVQRLVHRQVAEEMESMRERLRYGEGESPRRLRRRLRELWERDFEPTTRTMAGLGEGSPLAWDEVETHLADAAARIEVRLINGSAGDALEYVDHPDGISVIAVGGDKLSRGLTLEGLSVSYYLRASRMYDTLMQMGRWFGYRPGYADLCRLHTTTELRDWYSDITVANEELLTKFDEMAAVGADPEAFALYVRQSPDGLLITARAKMRNGRAMQLAFAGDVIETINFSRAVDPHRRNLQRLGPWLEEHSREGRESAERVRDNLLWRGVPGGDVARLLEGWQNAPNARRAQATLLARYIRSRLRDGELGDWTVVLINNGAAARRPEIAGRTMGLTLRAEHPPGSDAETYNIRRLLSPPDEWIDLDAEESNRALERTVLVWERGGVRSKTRPTQPNGPGVRFARPPSRGLLLVYALDPAPSGQAELECIPALGVSFPESTRAQPIEYVVPNRYWDEFVAT